MINSNNSLKFGSQMQISIASMEIWQKNSKFFIFKMSDGRHIENSFFGYTTAPYWPINAKFGSDMKNRIQILVTWPIAFSPELSRELSDFDEIWYIVANFHSEDGYLTKKSIFFSNSRWRTDAILKVVLAISRRLIGRLTRKSDQIWRITCRYWSCDQNGNFLKFMMVDGHNFENSFRCFRHYCNELMLSSVFFSIGVLVIMKSWKQQILYRKTAHSIYICTSRYSKTAKTKLFINYKREMSKRAHTFQAYNL